MCLVEIISCNDHGSDKPDFILTKKIEVEGLQMKNTGSVVKNADIFKFGNILED